MLAASRENDSVTLEKLLACPRDPNVLHTDGGTPLHHAARAGHTEPMRLLLEAGAEKDARDTEVQGYTPLLVAALNCQADSVALLIQAGADTDLATLDYGGTALHFAALSGHVEVARLLIEGGADRELTTVSSGVIPAHFLFAGLALQIALTIPNGATPLILAARMGYLEVVRLLVEAGADTNATEWTSTKGPPVVKHLCTWQHRMVMLTWLACCLLLGLTAQLEPMMGQRLFSSQLNVATTRSRAC